MMVVAVAERRVWRAVAVRDEVDDVIGAAFARERRAQDVET